MRSAVAALALCAACGEDRLDLRIDAVVTPQSVSVSAIERDPPRVCDDVPFPEVGVCDETTDVIQCTGTPPADAFAAVRVERDGAVLATFPWDRDGTGGRVELGDSAATLVIVTDDGDELAIAIPDTPRPIPTVTAITDLGDTVRVDWTATPAATTAITTVGGSYGGSRCHLAADERPELEWTYDFGVAFVHAFAPAIETSSRFGDVHVWLGAVAGGSWP